MKRFVVVSESDDSEIGIFHILDLLEEQDMTPADYGDLEWAERKLNLELPIPLYPNGIKTEAWFTEEGARHFEDALDILDILVGEYLGEFGYHFYELTNSPNTKEMYSDKYQVIYYR